LSDRVLVVDDEKEIASLVVESLQERGIDAAYYTDPRQCLKDLAESGASLVVSDIKMPGMDGLEFVKRAKAICPGIAAIIITGYAKIEYAVTALRQGVDDFFLKPFRIEELLKVIEKNLSLKKSAAGGAKALHALANANNELARQRSMLEKRFHKMRNDLDFATQSLSKTSEALDALSDLSEKLISEIDVHNLLTLCLDLITERLSVRKSFVLLTDDESLVVAASRPDGLWQGARLSTREGLGSRLASADEPVFVADSSRLSWAPPDVLGASFVAVPMVFNGKHLGALIISEREDDSPLGEPELNALTVIARQMSIAVSNSNLHRALKDSAMNAVKSLVVSLEVKDPYTSGHSHRVTFYACEMAKEAGFTYEEIECIKYAGQLHDIGKIGIPERILLKPEGLTEEEYKEIKTHPVIGERIVSTLDFLGDTRPLIRHHHERWDGNGYPDGLSGEEIPRLAALMTVADVYDAMTSARAYRPPLELKKAFKELQRGVAKQFAPYAVELFFSAYNRLPHPNEIDTTQSLVVG